MRQKALDMAEETLPKLRQHPGYFHLQTRMAAWYLELGDHKKAHDIYMAVSDDLKQKQALHAVLKKRFLKEDVTLEQEPVSQIYALIMLQ